MSYIRDLRSENAKGNSVTNKAPMSPKLAEGKRPE